MLTDFINAAEDRKLRTKQASSITKHPKLYQQKSPPVHPPHVGVPVTETIQQRAGHSKKKGNKTAKHKVHLW